LSDLFALSRDEDNERVVLSGALRDVLCYKLFVDLEAKDFFDAKNRCVAEALLQAGQPSSLDLILALCRKTVYTQPTREELIALYGTVRASVAEYKKHIELIKSDSRKRTIEDELLPELVESLATRSIEISRVSDVALRIKDIADVGAGKSLISTAADALEQYAAVEEARLNKQYFRGTGFARIDQHLTRGFFPGGITVLAGRPGMGKSAAVINSILRLGIGKNSVPGILFSLEMSLVSVLDRVLARLAGIPFVRIAKHFSELTPTERQQYESAKVQLRKNTHVHFCDTAGVSLQFIREQIRRFQVRTGQQFCVAYVDLFGKIRDLREDFLAQSYERSLNQMQAIARELGVHFVLVAQIRRDAEGGRKSIWKNRPSLNDIKNSGAWEEVADLVLFLFRAKYYNPELEDDVLEMHVAKQRDGLANVTEYFRFSAEYSMILDEEGLLPYDRREYSEQNRSAARTQSSQETRAQLSNLRRRRLADDGASSRASS